MSKQGRVGRPRSEHARLAVLHAVDDLVSEIGYGAVTLKGIAERAGVSRQTIYRWWSTKAEVLLEASVIDAREHLDVRARDAPVDDLAGYLEALVDFLSNSDAGTAYRALLGEAQHDAEVRDLLRRNDPIGESAAVVIARALPGATLRIRMTRATALLVGPIFFWVLSGRAAGDLDPRSIAEEFLAVAAPEMLTA